jgi:hypothetical protein
VHAALAADGKFLFTTLNGLFPLFNSLSEFINRESGQGSTRDDCFDLMTFRYHSVYETTDDSGNRKALRCTERYYVPSEITWQLRSLGFVGIGIYGCAAPWGRTTPLTANDFEMLVVAEKPAPGTPPA